jgi:Secretion system C-terminal sorting domain/Polysaccharide lyase
MTDWVSVPASGGWYGQQIEDACRMHPDASFFTWHNKTAVRVEVDPGDDPLALNSNSERAEMLFAQDQSGNPIQENNASGVQYYATSYYFPAGWLGQQLPWSTFSPVNCSANPDQCNSWSFVLQFHGGSFIWGGLAAAQTSLGGVEHYIFNGNDFTTNGNITLGAWTDFIFKINWGTGAYTVNRRDQGQTTFTEVLTGTTAVPAGSSIYLKQGLYRGGAVNGRTDVFWIGPTARGTTAAAVEQQVFGAVVLPIKLKSFTAVPQNNGVVLKWVVSEELNVSHYEATFSEDGRNFRTIVNIAANNNSNYSMVHNNAGSTGLVYYKLKIVDLDGKISYSNIIRVNVKETTSILIAKNPATNNLNISGLKSSGQISIADLTGKVLFQKNVLAQGLSIDISFMQPGLYFLYYFNGNKTETQKFLKQ